MTTSKHPVCAVSTCDRPAQAVICRGCTRQLTAALREIATGGIGHKRVQVIEGVQFAMVDYRPGLAEELDATMARLNRRGGGTNTSRATSAEPELPYHAAAAALVHELRNTVTTWARVLLDEHPRGPAWRGTTTAAVAGWLSMQPTALAMLPAAADLLGEILALRRRVRAVVDPGIDRAYVGPCGAETDAGRCTRDLYARLDRAEWTCPGCGARWNVAERREWLKGQVDDQLATVTEISRAMPVLLGGQLAESTVRWWACVGKLRQHAPHPGDGRRRPRYRVGDVIDLALAQAASESA